VAVEPLDKTTIDLDSNPETELKLRKKLTVQLAGSFFFIVNSELGKF